MPIFYNFHILLATFYSIFGTNILIQCPVPVPVCCMFYVSRKPNIKRNPNGIKTDRELFWNIWDFPEEESTRNGARGGHKPLAAPRVGGVPQGPVGPSGIVSRWFRFPKITYIPKKSPSFFIPLGLRLVWIFCETKNMQQTRTDTGHWINMFSPKNSIKSCQKYMKVVEYWHEPNKNYRYDGDVSPKVSFRLDSVWYSFSSKP